MRCRYKRYGDVFHVRLMGTDVYVVGNMAAVRAVWRGDTSDFMVPGSAFGKLITQTGHMTVRRGHGLCVCVKGAADGGDLCTCCCGER